MTLERFLGVHGLATRQVRLLLYSSERSNSWSDLLGTNITGDGSDAVLIDTNVTMSVNRFYRLKLVP